MNWADERQKWHTAAVESLVKFGKVPFMLRIYPVFTEDACAVWVEEDGLSDEARMKLDFLNVILRVKKPAAVLVQSDIWGTDSVRFSKHFGLSPDLPYEDFQKEYSRILHERFDGSIANMPDEIKSEAVFTVLKGPLLHVDPIFTYYRRSRSGRVVIERVEETMMGVLNLVPDWWKTTVH